MESSKRRGPPSGGGAGRRAAPQARPCRPARPAVARGRRAWAQRCATEYRRAFSEPPAAVPCSSRAPPSTTRTASAASAHLRARGAHAAALYLAGTLARPPPRTGPQAACAALLCGIAPPHLLIRPVVGLRMRSRAAGTQGSPSPSSSGPPCDAGAWARGPAHAHTRALPSMACALRRHSQQAAARGTAGTLKHVSAEHCCCARSAPARGQARLRQRGRRPATTAHTARTGCYEWEGPCAPAYRFRVRVILSAHLERSTAGSSSSATAPRGEAGTSAAAGAAAAGAAGPATSASSPAAGTLSSNTSAASCARGALQRDPGPAQAAGGRALAAAVRRPVLVLAACLRRGRRLRTLLCPRVRIGFALAGGAL